MIKITDLVEEAIAGDDITKEALKLGLLNLSSYARRIGPNIEAKLYRKVSRGAIVVALSRIKNKIKDAPDYRPNVVIDNISIQSPLAEVSYEKTRETIRNAASLRLKTTDDSFFTLTQGLGEITIICHQEFLPQVEKQMAKRQIKGRYQRLAAITVKFREHEYVEVPNMIFTLVSAFAAPPIYLI